MTGSANRVRNSTLHLPIRPIRGPFAALVLLLACVTIAAQAQTFTVLHSFTGGGDGGPPIAGLTMDRGGNLYGTTAYGGSHGYGVVFKMAEKNSNWILSPLHRFAGQTADGCDPVHADLAFGPDGSLYGTTPRCGNIYCGTGCGIVYRLRPSSNPPRNAHRAMDRDDPVPLPWLC